MRRTEQGQDWIEHVGQTLRNAVPMITRDLMALTIDAIPELRDPVVVERLHSSIESNVAEMVHMMAQGQPADQARPPQAAVEYARLAAQRGVSAGALIRAYRIPHPRMAEWCLDTLNDQSLDPRELTTAVLRLTRFITDYVDRVTEAVVEIHADAAARWQRFPNTLPAGLLHRVLAGAQDAATALEQITGYRMRQHHLAAVVWSAGSPGEDMDIAEVCDRRLAAAAKAHGWARPLAVPVDETTAYVWFATQPHVELRCLDDLGDWMGAPGVRVAIGTVREGLSGFAATHREALAAQRVAVAAAGHGGSVTTYATVAPISFLVDDLPRLVDFVSTTLGGLAQDTPAHATLRTTLYAFLTSGDSYVSTAAHLSRHKNTVHYRVNRAKEILGTRLDGRRLDVELSLRASIILGSAVLCPADVAAPAWPYVGEWNDD